MPGGRVETHLDDSPFATGTHKGADNATVLYDPGKDFKSCGVQVGSLIKNTTDGSSGAITAVDENTVTATLTGATDPTIIHDTGAFTLGGDDQARVALTTSTKVTVTVLDLNEGAYVIKDMGAGYFSGNFECRTQMNFSLADSGQCKAWALSNSIDTLHNIQHANGDYLSVGEIEIGGSSLILGECNGGTLTSAIKAGLSLNTEYYVKIVRDEFVGEFGTLYAYVYSDADYATLVISDSLALTEKQDFQYLYWMSSNETAHAEGDPGRDWTGTIQNLTTRLADIPNIWQAGDTYEIFITSEENSKISSIWTDKRYGHKYDKRKLIAGLIPEDIDDDEWSRNVFSEGQPEGRRR